MRPAPLGRGWLTGRPGAVWQIVLIVIGVMALPGDWWLSPLLLAALAAALMWLAGDNWRVAGFGRPGRPAFRWVMVAVAVGGLWQYGATGVLAPLAGQLLNSPPAPAPVPAGLAGLLFSVTIFGLLDPLSKGLAYRGFLLSRLERVAGSSLPAMAVNVLLAAIVFGLGNRYQGPVGVIVGALTGVLFNILYYWAGRNVWPSVLAHAIYNGVALTLLYLAN